MHGGSRSGPVPLRFGACRLLAPLLAALTPTTTALDNGLGHRPPLGWSSWNHFGGNINAEIVKQTADAMLKNGLRDAGYVYLNVDGGWALNRSATDGVLLADPRLFPPSARGANDGIKLVADYVHKRGFKMGICAPSSALPSCLPVLS